MRENMTEEWKRKFMEQLEQQFRTITEEITLGKTEDGNDVLRALFSTLEGGKGVALFESQLFHFREDALHLEITVTPQFNIAQEQLQQIQEAVTQLNYYAPMGAFGIYYPSRQLFLRYVAMLDITRDMDVLVGEIRKIYEILGGVLGHVYEALERVCMGNSTYDQEVKEGNLLKQM